MLAGRLLNKVFSPDNLYKLTGKMRDHCVALSVVKEELRKLADAAHASGDHALAEKFEEELRGMNKSHSRGGARTDERRDWDRCDKITTAMLMTAGAGLSYLAYVNVLPSVMKIVPTTCAGPMDRVKSMFVSIFDETASCYAKQKQWTSFKNAIYGGIFGTATMAPLGPKIASFMGVDREGLKGKYNKLYEFNRKHVCPYFEKAAKDVEAGKCVEAPEGELKKVIERGIQVEESKSRSPVKKRNRTAKRARSSRKPDFFEMLHPGAESSSRSERSMSSSMSASKSESRSASKSKSESASASKSGRTAKRARKSESPVSAKSREGDDIRKYFSPTKKASKREGADIRSFFSSTKRAKSSTGGKRRTRRRR